ncbi:MAG: hypothetical protein INQ03_14450 [Candidatus Heimdallarchaeota archaeon]|nr:hypothetical protein [Candidatus Heimdallarchaeota archaeon]
MVEFKVRNKMHCLGLLMRNYELDIPSDECIRFLRNFGDISYYEFTDTFFKVISEELEISGFKQRHEFKVLYKSENIDNARNQMLNFEQMLSEFHPE